MTARFSKVFSAAPEHIDELGHLNNAVWVQWVQDLATAHWQDTARAADRDAYVWVVIRHELDYRGNIAMGETALGETFLPGKPSGAKFGRRADFRDAGGTLIVSANTTWAMIDRASGRPTRVRAEIAAPFIEIPD